MDIFPRLISGLGLVRVRVMVRVGVLYESVRVAKCPNHVIRARVRLGLKILIYLTFQFILKLKILI